MDSDHLVNIAIMLFNHLCLAWESEQYLIEHNEDREDFGVLAYCEDEPVEMVKYILCFMQEIEDRGYGYLSRYAKRRYYKLLETFYQSKFLEGKDVGVHGTIKIAWIQAPKSEERNR